MNNPPPPPNFEDYRLAKLKAFCSKYEVNINTVVKLRQLEEFEICCLCDDSGSMATPIETDNADPFAKRVTRWDELAQTMSLVLELATCLDKNGVDIYFMNRPPLYNVASVQQVQVAFQTSPEGYTPTVRTLTNLFNEKAAVLSERKLLLILATDGQPTDDNGNVQLQQFVSFIKNKPKNLYLSIVACTDDDGAVDYLDGFISNGYPNLDVTDDYKSEREEVKKKTGKTFTFGDYVCKVMLGPVDPSFGDRGLFAPPPAARPQPKQSGGCCIVS